MKNLLKRLLIFMLLITGTGAWLKNKFSCKDGNEAIKYAKIMRKKGFAPQFNILGEHYKDLNATDKLCDDYLDLIEKLKEAGISNISIVSVKPSSLGLDLNLPADSTESQIDHTIFYLRKILLKAKGKGIFVRLDREGKKYDEAYQGIVNVLTKEFDNFGPCVQIGRKISVEEATNWNKLFIRICKGAYIKEREVKNKKNLRSSFIAVSKLILLQGGTLEVATHDVAIYDELINFKNKEKNIEDKIIISVLKGKPVIFYLESLNVKKSIYIPICRSLIKSLEYSVRRIEEEGIRLIAFFLK